MKRLLATAFILLSAAAALCAQEFKTGYFLDNYSYAYRINPAAPVEGKPYTFIGLGLGNTTASFGSNLGSSSLFHKANGSWWAFTDFDNYPADLMEKRLNSNKTSSLFTGLDFNILTFGRQNENNRITVEINSKTNARLAIPNNLFYILRLAGTNQDKSYSFNALTANVQSYMELAVGYTHVINDYVTVGARLKGLGGLGSMGTSLDMNGRKSTVKDVYLETKLNAYMAYPVAFTFPTTPDGGVDILDTDNLDLGTIDWSGLLKSRKTLPGLGAALDLGVTVTPVDGLTLDLSVLDLGFISWKDNINVTGTYQKDCDFTFNDLFPDRLIVNSVDRHLSWLEYNIHLGAKYRMPFYDRLSVGLLGTFQKYYKEARLGIDVTPIDFISLAASAAYGSYGFDLGAALNIRFPGVNFFLGVDSIPGVGFGLDGEPSTFPVGLIASTLVEGLDSSLTKLRVPTLRLNTTATAGLLIAF